MKVILYLFCAFLLLLSNACETWQFGDPNDLDFGSGNIAIDLFIEGGITTQLCYHKIFLYKPGSYANHTESVAITDALVFIVTSVNDTIKFSSVDTVWNPYYITQTRVRAEKDKFYTLHIEYNGSEYTATDKAVDAPDFEFSSILLPVIDGTQKFQGNGTTKNIALQIAKHDFGYPQSNAWNWIEKNRFVDSINYKEQSPFLVYTHWRADVQGIFSNVNYYYSFGSASLSESDTLITIEYSLSDAYYNYLRAKFMETDWKEGYFSSQPGNLPTNLSKGAAGFFYVSDFRMKQITVIDLLQIIE